MDLDKPVPWLCERCCNTIDPDSEIAVVERRTDPHTGKVLVAHYHRVHAPSHLLREA